MKSQEKFDRPGLNKGLNKGQRELDRLRIAEEDRLHNEVREQQANDKYDKISFAVLAEVETLGEITSDDLSGRDDNVFIFLEKTQAATVRYAVKQSATHDQQTDVDIELMNALRTKLRAYGLFRSIAETEIDRMRQQRDLTAEEVSMVRASLLGFDSVSTDEQMQLIRRSIIKSNLLPPDSQIKLSGRDIRFLMHEFQKQMVTRKYQLLMSDGDSWQHQTDQVEMALGMIIENEITQIMEQYQKQNERYRRRDELDVQLAKLLDECSQLYPEDKYLQAIREDILGAIQARNADQLKQAVYNFVRAVKDIPVENPQQERSYDRADDVLMAMAGTQNLPWQYLQEEMDRKPNQLSVIS